jgi:transcriptional regulator with XRE-family HTH domain
MSQKMRRAVCAQVITLLREERQKRKISKYAVAQRAGVSQQMIGYVERGLRQPSLEIVLRIADGLGLDLADVITRAQRIVSERHRKEALSEPSKPRTLKPRL